MPGQLGSGQHVGHTDDAVQGGADLVAHVGQEGALGLVGGLSSLGRLLQFDRGAALVGDVFHHPDDVAGPFLAEGGQELGLQHLLVFALAADVLDHADGAGADHVGLDLEHAVGVMGAQLMIGLAQDVVAAVAEDLLGLLVDQHIAPVRGVLGEQHQGRRIQDGVQERLGAHLGGDVVAESQQADHAPVGAVQDRRDHGVPPRGRSVRRGVPGAEAGGLGLAGRGQHPFDVLAIVLGPQLQPRPAHHVLAALGVQELQAAVVDELHAAIGAQDGHIILARLQDAEEQTAVAIDLLERTRQPRRWCRSLQKRVPHGPGRLSRGELGRGTYCLLQA